MTKKKYKPLFTNTAKVKIEATDNIGIASLKLMVNDKSRIR